MHEACVGQCGAPKRMRSYGFPPYPPLHHSPPPPPVLLPSPGRSAAGSRDDLGSGLPAGGARGLADGGKGPHHLQGGGWGEGVGSHTYIRGGRGAPHPQGTDACPPPLHSTLPAPFTPVGGMPLPAARGWATRSAACPPLPFTLHTFWSPSHLLGVCLCQTHEDRLHVLLHVGQCVTDPRDELGQCQQPGGSGQGGCETAHQIEHLQGGGGGGGGKWGEKEGGKEEKEGREGIKRRDKEK